MTPSEKHVRYKRCVKQRKKHCIWLWCVRIYICFIESRCLLMHNSACVWWGVVRRVHVQYFYRVYQFLKIRIHFFQFFFFNVCCYSWVSQSVIWMDLRIWPLSGLNAIEYWWSKLTKCIIEMNWMGHCSYMWMCARVRKNFFVYFWFCFFFAGVRCYICTHMYTRVGVKQ